MRVDLKQIQLLVKVADWSGDIGLDKGRCPPSYAGNPDNLACLLVNKQRGLRTQRQWYFRFLKYIAYEFRAFGKKSHAVSFV